MNKIKIGTQESMKELFLSKKALIKLPDSQVLTEQLIYLVEHPDECQQMGKRALEVVNANRGALQKQLTLLHEVLVKHLGKR